MSAFDEFSAANPPTAHESGTAPIPPTIDPHALQPQASFLRIFGVNYVHLQPGGEGDLYVTEEGLPFIEHLMPINWYEEQWFKANRRRLEGTSAVYFLSTRPLPKRRPASIDLVVKWSRVGQDVPLDTFTFDKAVNAEFNTPFEEFSLVNELRRGDYGPGRIRILTQKPLAIYVPPEKLQLWQTGRSKDKVLSKVARHPGVEIDILRSYILLYGWIKGHNTVEAYQLLPRETSAVKQEVADLTNRVHEELRSKGFTVADHKPSHMIVRLRGGDLCRRKDGRLVYALIDYELLQRTPEHEEAVKRSLRSSYLQRMKERFKPRPASAFPPHLAPAQHLGVPYVYGRTESTGGALWVVGCDPELFNYFLPERWRTRMVKLSQLNQTYYTTTKDRIHLIWKVSRVGELPPGDINAPDYKAIQAQGFNSPFEEFAYALELASKGVRAVYPRAIYMTGQQVESRAYILDDSRFRKYADQKTPDGAPLLPRDHDFITIWGYWRGLEDGEAPVDQGYWTPIDLTRAVFKGLVSRDQAAELTEQHRRTLAEAGFADSALRGDHILLSYIPEGVLKKDEHGNIEMRQCNFELVRRI